MDRNRKRLLRLTSGIGVMLVLFGLLIGREGAQGKVFPLNSAESTVPPDSTDARSAGITRKSTPTGPGLIGSF